MVVRFSLMTIFYWWEIMEAVIFIDIQAVGKSTFYKKHFFKTHLRLNLDMLRTRHREQVLLQACLDAKQRFVVDNTNPTREDRAKYIQLATSANFKVIGYYFQSKVDDAQRRNAIRDEKERVPEKGLLGTYARLQLPTFDEGFDELYYVAIGEDGEFAVKGWVDEI